MPLLFLHTPLFVQISDNKTSCGLKTKGVCKVLVAVGWGTCRALVLAVLPLLLLKKTLKSPQPVPGLHPVTQTDGASQRTSTQLCQDSCTKSYISILKRIPILMENTLPYHRLTNLWKTFRWQPMNLLPNNSYQIFKETYNRKLISSPNLVPGSPNLCFQSLALYIQSQYSTCTLYL
ncbi:hypothetical protein GYMLUDRAFT_278522 [Collybiopsis luxurians FD-317 M1]|nr:hypothetical protein GYMLUDRAFT_278522 [Collybiopsis luxurians FD-317 M1]